LRTALLDLLFELGERAHALILAGGYGLFLKQVYLLSDDVRTLLARDLWPEARSTGDLDIFLPAEFLVDAATFDSIRPALDRLGYVAVETAKYYQFVKPLAGSRNVKIDVHCGPLEPSIRSDMIKRESGTSARRVRPRKARSKLHGRWTDEALGLEDGDVQLSLDGFRSNGEWYSARIRLPAAFPYLMMKLHAFHDRENSADHVQSQHHVMDLYRIVAMMTETEYERAKELATQFAQARKFREACRIVRERFSTEEAVGIVRLREHPLSRADMKPAEFLSLLHELFAPP
jgi:hypothetical protein